MNMMKYVNKPYCQRFGFLCNGLHRSWRTNRKLRSIGCGGDCLGSAVTGGQANINLVNSAGKYLDTGIVYLCHKRIPNYVNGKFCQRVQS